MSVGSGVHVNPSRDRAYSGIRTPKAHSMTHDLTAIKAAQYLVLASLLARRIDEAR